MKAYYEIWLCLGTVYAIIGEDTSTQGLCEKLMDINMQIQRSLQQLEKPRAKQAHESHAKSQSVVATSSMKPVNDLSLKRTSF